MILKSIWGKVKRDWGYEVRIDIDDNGNVINEVLTFTNEPAQIELDSAITGLLVSLEQRKIIYEVTNEDGTITQS